MKKNKVYNKILVLSDLHCPFVNWFAVKQAYKWSRIHKPDLIVCTGDITDQKIWSKWPKDLDDMSPHHEFIETQKCLERLHKMFPSMIILRGNHDYRVQKNAVEAKIPAGMFKDLPECFNFKGWQWLSPEERLTVKTQRGKILFQHGDEMGGNVSQKSRILGKSVIQGHTHKASITYTQASQHFFGAEAGCLMDINSKGAKYAQANPVGVSVGFMVIKYGVPYFISYEEKAKV